MKQKLSRYLIFLGLPFILSGCCNRYVVWLRDVFYQGSSVETERAVVEQYIRSEHIYDQLTTLAHFDALWLSDEVRSAFSFVHAQKLCLSEERYQVFLRRQLEENTHYISFYVLAAIPTSFGSDVLTDKDADWSFCLTINDKTYRPVQITLVDLQPEYSMFFGSRYTRFKKAYQVRFDARDDHGDLLLSPSTPYIKLWFSRVDRKACAVWCLDSRTNVVYREITNPDTLAYSLACP
jgi:hypothetical protein